MQMKIYDTSETIQGLPLLISLQLALFHIAKWTNSQLNIVKTVEVFQQETTFLRRTD